MFNNIKMKVIQSSKNGIVNKETLFHFEQVESKVKAHYSGGQIKKGYLVGHLNGNILSFIYNQERISGEIDHGESECILSIDKDSGKIILEENFKMTTQVSEEMGTNIFMEI